MADYDFNSLPPAGDTEASRQRFLHCTQQGLLRHAISTNVGGLGDRFADLVEIHTRLGKACLDSGLILSINAHLWGAVFPILNHGDEQQKTQWLALALTGTCIAGHAITEPQAGSDLNALTTVADNINGRLLLNGHKRFITNTPIADFLVIYALLDNKLTAFIVERNDSGVEFLDGPTVTGCATATMGDVILKDCLIPASRQLGKTGAGTFLIQQAMELERAFVFAGLSGIMAKQLDHVIDYSRERKINGKHLAANQAISHKIAEMKLRLDTVGLWLEQCARLKDNKQRITLASAQTKLYASEAFLQSSLDAIHLLGAQGLAKDNPWVNLVNDAMASRLFSGSSEIQKNIIAALSGVGDGYRA